MVRKWSYINFNKVGILLYLSTVRLYLNLFNYKIFKINTRFRKYILHTTSFIRRKYIFRKRVTSYQIYVNIIGFWIKLFLNNKSLIMFLQLYNIVTASGLIPSTNFIYKDLYKITKAVSGVENICINLFSLKTSLLRYNFFKFKTFLKYNNLVGPIPHVNNNIQVINLYPKVIFFKFYVFFMFSYNYPTILKFLDSKFLLLNSNLLYNSGSKTSYIIFYKNYFKLFIPLFVNLALNNLIFIRKIIIYIILLSIIKKNVFL